MEDEQDINLSEMDEELLEIFIDEGADIVADLEIAMDEWRASVGEPAAIDKLKRYLHTLKGGARLADLNMIGDLSHELESVLVNIEEKSTPCNVRVIAVVQQVVDELASMLERIEAFKLPKQNTALLNTLHQLMQGEVPPIPEPDPKPEPEPVVEQPSLSVAEIEQAAKYSRSLTDGGSLHVVRSVLIPLHKAYLLLPNAAVAEIVPYTEPEALAASPDWCLGLLAWRGQNVPIISYEKLLGGVVPKVSRYSRIAICNAISGVPGLPFFGLVCATIPHLMRVHEKNIQAAPEQTRRPTTLQDVVVEKIAATIPRIDAIEDLVRKNVSMA